ncbi:hypothetical protein JHK82_018739 [Glycine max]|nr:hypothetical protein JHK85_019181 [Glycine max]KAG5143044.1 hypothetical protein JHK82_018739 [Glycine max]
MWDLVARDRWVIFDAFSALIVATVRYGDFDTAFLDSIHLHSTEYGPCCFSPEYAVVGSVVRGFGNMKVKTLYEWWLEKLVDISLQQSAAYGVWNFSFNILYHSTQVITVLFGGMSILVGHITAEKLRRSWSNKAPKSITLSFNCPSYKKLSITLKASSGTSLKVTSEDMLSFGSCSAAARRESVRPDDMRQATWCGGCLILLEAASPTHEHNELKRSLVACVNDELERSLEAASTMSHDHDPRGVCSI